MIAVHLGVVSEDDIGSMSMVFFDDILKELRYKINYDAVVNYAGNSYMPDAWDIISKADPFNVEGVKGEGSGLSGFAKFLSGSNIEIIKKSDKGERGINENGEHTS